MNHNTRLSWTPYGNLFHLAYHQVCDEDLGSTSPAALRRRALLMAERLARQAFPGLVLPFPWPKAPLPLPEEVARPPFSRRLRRLLMRRSLARTRLDELILAHTLQGREPAEVYIEAYEDYMNAPDAVALGQQDALAYGFFYWDFASLEDLSPGEAWIRQVLGAGRELSILQGACTLSDVRLVHGVTRGFDPAAHQQRLAQQLGALAGQVLTSLTPEGRTTVDALVNGRQVTDPATGKLRRTKPQTRILQDVTVLVREASASLRAANGLSDAGSDASLYDFVRTGLDKLREEQKADTYMDWRQLDRGRTLEEVMAENERVEVPGDDGAAPEDQASPKGQV